MGLTIKYYFFIELVIRRCTSCLSSSSIIAPKYPTRLSENFELAISLRHSSWKERENRKKQKSMNI